MEKNTSFGCTGLVEPDSKTHKQNSVSMCVCVLCVCLCVLCVLCVCLCVCVCVCVCVSVFCVCFVCLFLCGGLDVCGTWMLVLILILDAAHIKETNVEEHVPKKSEQASAQQMHERQSECSCMAQLVSVRVPESLWRVCVSVCASRL